MKWWEAGDPQGRACHVPGGGPCSSAIAGALSQSGIATMLRKAACIANERNAVQAGTCDLCRAFIS
jgi:hypothetical protein